MTGGSMDGTLIRWQESEALESLDCDVAHDLKNLLMAVKTFGDLLKRRIGDNADAVRDLDQIQKAVDRATHLLASGCTLSVTQQVLDLNAVVRSLSAMLHSYVGETVSLRLALAPDLGRVKANKRQLERVLTNLVINARDS